ncbi:trypsin-like peptidase domain-containing protein [Antarctobacter sp.]|uniref:trypsin-like peptidase domain-containing protein n=1 Tax=Antarctobacter sp. TaxID=1872577 RepID=UPI003A8CF25B
MRRVFAISAIALLAAAPLCAQPVEFDPSDFGKIVVAKRQSAGTGFVLEQAFGDYQNEPVISYGEKSIARRLGRPVGRLDVLYGNGKTGYCTAFIVDSEHLVTNNHCIPGVGDPGVQAAQFVAGYVDAAHPDTAEKFQVQLQALETSAPLDYSVLRVFGDPSARYGTVELADADPESSEFLWIIGHPQGQAQHISREGCAAADPPVSTEGKVVHSCDTLGGNSGSPVFRISDRQVVALHHAGDSRTGFNFAIPMTRILANSKILKAAAPAGPIAPPPDAKSACEVLWGAAEQHGCLGYQTFLSQCGDHVLAPLARGLADRSCKADVATTPPTGGPDPADDRLKTEIAKALETAERQRAEISKESAAAERAVRSLQGTLNRARARAGDAESSFKPGSAEVAGLWRGVADQIDSALSEASARAQVMPRMLDDMDRLIDTLRGATTEAEVDSVTKRTSTLSESSRERLAFVVARKTVVDKLFAEGEATVVVLLQDSVRDQTDTSAAIALRSKIQQAQTASRAHLSAARKAGIEALEHYAVHELLIRDAYAQAAAARKETGPASAESAALWEALARGLSGEARRMKSRVDGMQRFTDTISTTLATLPDATTEADVTTTLLRIEGNADLSADWLGQVATRTASAREQFAETEVKVAALRATAESTTARPAIVTRCLEVAMPMFAVEGIAGVSREDFDAGSAELACSAARKVSDDPAVHYGLARALIDRKRYDEALRILQNPRMDGFIPARYSLGVAYNSALGVRQDYGKALALYHEATNAGYPQGKFSLGVYYSLGRAVRVDHARAGALLVESIADGYAHPITQLHKLPGATTRAIQLELVTRGYLSSRDVDGAFGPTTRRALEQLAAAAAR